MTCKHVCVHTCTHYSRPTVFFPQLTLESAQNSLLVNCLTEGVGKDSKHLREQNQNSNNRPLVLLFSRHIVVLRKMCKGGFDSGLARQNESLYHTLLVASSLINGQGVGEREKKRERELKKKSPEMTSYI